MHHLFTALSPEYRQRLESLPTALDTVAPLRTAHRRDLPMAIRDLSQMLTSERGALSEPYWAAPRLLSAYLRYFMPWNLVRLGRLLPSLDLVDRDALLERPLILDLGSGPLTLPLALWLARPDLRTLPLTFLCADIAPHPLEVGRDLLQVVAGEESPWALRTLRAPLESALKEVRGDAALIMAGNVMNELKPRRDEPLEFRMEDLAEKIGAAMAQGGRLLVIEPGTRLGARYVTQFRRAAMEVGLAPLAPCPHHDACPMLETGGPGGWCHFTFPIQGAPAWLEELSRRAKLEKGTASLSFVLLGEADKVAPPRNTIRIISDAFPLPGRREPVRYACSERGLALLHDARQVHSGTALEITWPEVERRDRKSGALELEWTPPARGADKGADKGTDRGAKSMGTAGGAAARTGRKPARGKAVGHAAPMQDGDDDLQPAFLLESGPQWGAPTPGSPAGFDAPGDLDEHDGHDEFDGHDPSEPDGNRVDGPDHGQTYGQMFANQPHGGRAAQRRGVPRFGARRGHARDGGFDAGFSGQRGGLPRDAYGQDGQFGGGRRGVSDDFGNRADAGGRADAGNRRSGRPGGRTGGDRQGGQRGEHRDAPRGEWTNRRGPQRPAHGKAAPAQSGPSGPGHYGTDDAPAARQTRGEGRDGQQRPQGRAQRPFGNARRQRPDGPQEGRQKGRQDGRQDGRPDAPAQRGENRQAEGQGGHARHGQRPGQRHHGRPDPRDQHDRPDRREQREQRDRQQGAPQARPGTRQEPRQDARQERRPDRPGERNDRRPDQRPDTRQERRDAPRDGEARQQREAGRPGKPRRHFDREGRPGGDKRDRRDRPDRTDRPDRDGRATRQGNEQRGDRPRGQHEGGPQRPQQARPERGERPARGERSAERPNAPQGDRPERSNARRDDRKDDRRDGDRPDNAGQHHTRRRKPRRDD